MNKIQDINIESNLEGLYILLVKNINNNFFRYNNIYLSNIY